MTKFSGKISFDWIQENIGTSFLDGLPPQFDTLDADILNWKLEDVDLDIESIPSETFEVTCSRDGIHYQKENLIIPTISNVKKCQHGWLIVEEPIGVQWRKWIHDFESDEEEQDWQPVP